MKTVLVLFLCVCSILAQTFSYYGGYGDDRILSSTTGSTGNVYVTGYTSSYDLPVSISSTNKGNKDGFVAAYSPLGTKLWDLYIGGSSDDEFRSIAVDTSGNVFVVGTTSSVDFPVMSAYQANFVGTTAGVFVKLNSTGGMLFSSYFAPGNTTEINDVTLTSSGSIIFVGTTNSPNLPRTLAFRSSNNGTRDGFVTAFSSSFSIVLSSYLGGSSDDVAMAVATDGASVFIGGKTISNDFHYVSGYQSFLAGNYDAFVTQVDLASGQITRSTYLGGYGHDEITDLLLSSGKIFAIGNTLSGNFPMISAFRSSIIGGSSDAFVTCFSTLQSISWSTYLGGSQADYANSISTNGTYLIVSGTTLSSDFPSLNPIQKNFGGISDAFVTTFNPSNGNPIVSTILGGSYADSAAFAVVTTNSALVVVGSTASTNFASSANLTQSMSKMGSYDAYVIRTILPTPSAASQSGLAPYASVLDYGKNNRAHMTGSIVGGTIAGFVGLVAIALVAYYVYYQKYAYDF